MLFRSNAGDLSAGDGAPQPGVVYYGGGGGCSCGSDSGNRLRKGVPEKFLKNFKKPLANFPGVCYLILADITQSRKHPGVAKFGIALEWGSRGRWFESSHSDHPKSL